MLKFIKSFFVKPIPPAPEPNEQVNVAMRAPISVKAITDPFQPVMGVTFVGVVEQREAAEVAPIKKPRKSRAKKAE